MVAQINISIVINEWIGNRSKTTKNCLFSTNRSFSLGVWKSAWAHSTYSIINGNAYLIYRKKYGFCGSLCSRSKK